MSAFTSVDAAASPGSVCNFLMQQEILHPHPTHKFGFYRYDIEAVRSVRQFKGHTDRITDLRMSADARWLLSSSLDGTRRVWGRSLRPLPSGQASTQTRPWAVYLTSNPGRMPCWSEIIA